MLKELSITCNYQRNL